MFFFELQHYAGPNVHVVHFNSKVSSPQDLYIIPLAAAAQTITTNNRQCPNSSTPANQLPIIVLSSAMMAVPFFSKQQNSKLKCGWGLEFFVFFIFVRILWWQLADTTVRVPNCQLVVSIWLLQLYFFLYKFCLSFLRNFSMKEKSTVIQTVLHFKTTRLETAYLWSCLNQPISKDVNCSFHWISL